MSHYYESFINKKIDLNKELSKIDFILFNERKSFYNSSEYLIDFIDRIFRQLDLSCNYLSAQSYLNDSKENGQSPEEQFVFYCEAILSILCQLSLKLQLEHFSEFKRSVADINKILDYDFSRMNLTKKYINVSGMGDLIIIIPTDPLLESVLEDINNDSIEDYLIEYMSSHNDGNIKRKEELLKLLSNYVEGITKNADLRIIYKRLYENTDFLYNSLDLRHNQKMKDKRFYNRTLKEREKWLDITYRQTLLVIATEDEFKNASLIKKYKKEVYGDDGKV